MSDDDALREPFRAWLASRWSDVADLEIGVFQQPKSGFSAKTIFVPLSYRRAGRAIEDKIVLRLENPEPAIYPQQAPGLARRIANGFNDPRDYAEYWFDAASAERLIDSEMKKAA